MRKVVVNTTPLIALSHVGTGFAANGGERDLYFPKFS